jgi:hypothetical protein
MNGKAWTAEEQSRLRALYPAMPTHQVASLLKHTPAPWLNAGPFGYSIGIAAKSNWVAVVYGPTTNPQADADARLIVAAPKMYRALMAHQALDEQRANCDECEDCPESAAECCSRCFPFADAARLLMRELLEELHA